jgi:beta-glucosidase
MKNQCGVDGMTRIESLIGEMTLSEKLGQLTMTACASAVTGPTIAGDSTEAIKSGAIGSLLNLVGADHIRQMQDLAVKHSRLKIPLLIALDVIHGLHTVFPIPLAEAAMFDPDAWERTAREAALEAAADGIALTFAPMLDVARDPRWGRIAEGPGEDPWLASQIARAKVRGFQGRGLSDAGALAACAKHYCGYGAVNAGRDYASTDISDRTLYEVHMPAFRAAIDAGVATVMPAFTDLAGIPMTAHRALLRDHLRGRYGFDGVIISDYNAIGELLRHGVAADLSEAATLALRAGVDIDMMSNAYRTGLPVALGRGAVQIEEIDEAVRRVLALKERLGLFDDPYRRGSAPESVTTFGERRRLARQISARSVVMLQNVRATLPLPGTIRRLCVAGPLADATAEMGGCWCVGSRPDTHVSVLQGLRTALPETEISHAPGVAINGDDRSQIEEALEQCERAEAIVLCLGESANMSGEAASRSDLDLPGLQRGFAQAVFESASTHGIPVIVVLFSGRPLIVPWLFERADAILAAWFLGTEAGHAIADLVTGEQSPSARTPVSWPRSMGQVPVFFAQRPGGRPANPNDHYTSKYLDAPNDPVIHFGHGLTYGQFRYSNLRVTPERVHESDTLMIEVDLVNVGARAGEETVFLFTHDRLASVSRPLLELKGFGRIHLQPGQSGTVCLALPASELRFLGMDLASVFEPGEVEILVGPSAERVKLLAHTVSLEA